MRSKILAVSLVLILSALAMFLAGTFLDWGFQRPSAALSKVNSWDVSLHKVYRGAAPLAIKGQDNEFVKVPFTSIGRSSGSEIDGDLYVNDKYQAKFVSSSLEFSFPFPGVPVDLIVTEGRYEFAFRKIFSGELFRLIYDANGSLLRQQAISFDGVDYPIFRASLKSDDGSYWVVYDNKKRKNYLVDIERFQEPSGLLIELPTFYPPAGGTYEMEPPVFLSRSENNGFQLIAGALYATIDGDKVTGHRLADCEVAIEVKFTSNGPAVLCRALEGGVSPYFLNFIGEGRKEYFDMVDGIPWRLVYSQESDAVSISRAKTPEEIMEMFVWDLSNNQQGGVLEFGINNIEGRIPWSQIYYLNGLMDLLLLANVNKDARLIFHDVLGDIAQRVMVEIESLDDLLDREGGFHTKGFTYDRSPALFSVQTSRLLLLFDRYTEEFPGAVPLRNINKLYKMVADLDGHIETLAYKGESEAWMKLGGAHLRWPKCSAFYFDGMAVPFNHQNEWAYSLFNAARVRDQAPDVPSLNDQRNIIEFFMERLGDRKGFPSTDKWYYWYGHAYDGWTKEDKLSCNMPEYVGDHGLAWISFRTIDFMSVLAAIDFMGELDKNQLLDSGFDTVRDGRVYPFAARSILDHGRIPQIKVSVLERYYRASSPWELSNTPWALVMGFDNNGK